MDRRRSPWRELAAASPAGDDSSAARGPGIEIIDGIVFSYEGESRCKVCGATVGARHLANAEEVRSTIDRMLVRGATYTAIVRVIEPLVESWPTDRRPSYHSIRRHQLRHLGSDEAAVREIVERRALEQGLRIAVGQGSIVTRAAILEIVRDKGFAALAAGEFSPTLAETLHAAETLEAIDREAGSVMSLGELGAQVRMFVDLVKARLPAEEFTALVAEMEARLGTERVALGSGKDQREEEERDG